MNFANLTECRLYEEALANLKRTNLDEAEMVLAGPRFELALAPRLRWIQYVGAGIDAFLTPEIIASDIMVTNASGVGAPSIAEYVLTMMLAFTHRCDELRDLQKHRIWPTSFQCGELRGKTVGILGYGSIGREVGRLCNTFGARVLAVKRLPYKQDRNFYLPNCGDPEGEIPEYITGPGQLLDVIAESDFVIITLPLTVETHGMINRQALQAAKGTYLINVGRGAIFDEQALIEALKERHLTGAALDVFQQEPLTPESEFWGLDNVTISPHCIVCTPDYYRRFAILCQENLRRYLNGEELLNIIDKQQGY